MRSTITRLLCTLAIVLGSAAPAFASNCFILVHGNMKTDSSDMSSKANRDALWQYWNQTGSFPDVVTQKTAHYAMVGWDSKNADGYPYWHSRAAGSVAQQILSITNGGGDIFTGTEYAHPRQCQTGDKFYLIAHSQGAQVVTYMNGNAYAGAPNLDTAIDAMDLNQLASAPRVSAPFSTALARIAVIFTLGGAINGTEGMDEVCGNVAAAAIVAVFDGKYCETSLQTYDAYNPSSFTGSTLYRPMYAFGGTATTYTSALLTGEDDGTVNLASQMNCAGSAKSDMYSDLTLKDCFYNTTFRCNRYNKRHVSNSFNLASVDIEHTNEALAPSGTFSHNMAAMDVLPCGDTMNAPNTIAACLSLVP
jgi:hypothetical protein